jgi:hypothetical protein
MARKMTRHGVTVVGGGGFYVTLDGRFEVVKVDDFETSCDEPHPVKLPREKWFMDGDYDSRGRWVTKLKKGYRCEGGGTHFYVAWHIWDRQNGWDGEYAEGTGPGEFDTFDEAMRDLADILKREAAKHAVE